MTIRIQTEDFDLGHELTSMRLSRMNNQLQLISSAVMPRTGTEHVDIDDSNKILNNKSNIGAMVSFVGQVREFENLTIKDNASINTLTLEHYPGMTEKALAAIELEAKTRWNIIDSLIIHRVGALKPQDQIVLVAVTSAHRSDAFKACEFIMDYLKTSAPFWKKVTSADGEHWVDAKISDDAAKTRWVKPD